MLHTIESLIASALPPTMSVEDAANLLGISRSTAYAEAARFRQTNGVTGIPNATFGTRVVVLTVPLLELLRIDRKPDGGSQAPDMNALA